VKTGGSQCEHIKDLGFAMSIISCPDFWRRITIHDGCMGMHGRSVFGVWRKVYRAMAARMMRRCGGALMGRKREGKARQNGTMWKVRGRRRSKRGELSSGPGEFFGRRQNALVNWAIVQRAREIFWRFWRRALRIAGCWWFFRCVSNYRKAAPWSEGRRTKEV
jgi:hypothetical protein